MPGKAWNYVGLESLSSFGALHRLSGAGEADLFKTDDLSVFPFLGEPSLPSPGALAARLAGLHAKFMS